MSNGRIIFIIFLFFIFIYKFICMSVKVKFKINFFVIPAFVKCITFTFYNI